MGDETPAKPATPPSSDADLRLQLYTSVESLHEKFDRMATSQLRYADDMLKVKERQNRHGRKIEEERRAREALEVWVGYPAATARQGAWQPGPPRPRMPSKEWDPEDTGQHMLTVQEQARLQDIVARDRSDSEFMRRLPRTWLLRGIAYVLALTVATGVGWFVSRASNPTTTIVAPPAH